MHCGMSTLNISSYLTPTSLLHLYLSDAYLHPEVNEHLDYCRMPCRAAGHSFNMFYTCYIDSIDSLVSFVFVSGLLRLK